jgi:hypothetical protein
MAEDELRYKPATLGRRRRLVEDDRGRSQANSFSSLRRGDRFMEDEKIDKEDVWSAIRYLDPDEREKEKEVNTATIIATLALLIIVGGVWVLLWLRVRQP